MEDIRGLTIKCKYEAFTSYSMDVESKGGFLFKVLYDSFDDNKADAMNNQQLNRYVVIQSELALLDDNEFKTFFDTDEVEALKKRLVEEADVLRTAIEQLESIKNNEQLRKGGSDGLFNKFDKRLNLLKDL